jgi:hypothetical protein
VCRPPPSDASGAGAGRRKGLGAGPPSALDLIGSSSRLERTWAEIEKNEGNRHENRFLTQPCGFLPNGAAQESNLPSLGLPDLTGFDDSPLALSEVGHVQAIESGVASTRSSM